MGLPTLGFVFLFLEFFLLIIIAGGIGFGPMLAEILLSGMLGVLLMRNAGRTLFQPAQLIGVFLHATGQLLTSRKPVEWLLLGSLLLIVPGVLSDLVGIALVLRWAVHRGSGDPPSPRSGSIDVEFDVHDEPPNA